MFKPGAQPNLISLGNQTFDRFLGGGLLSSSLNLFERRGPSSRLLDSIWNKSLASSTLAYEGALIVVNFNVSLSIEKQGFIESLPTVREVKSDLMFKDIRSRSALTKIKIAWRYSDRDLPSPGKSAEIHQVDFRLPLIKATDIDFREKIRPINVNEHDDVGTILLELNNAIVQMKQKNQMVNIIIKDILHPFSPLVNDSGNLSKFLYGLRCLARILDKGVILTSFDCDMCPSYNEVCQQLYNISDCVVSFYSYETGENLLTGYRDIDGTLSYIKFPKINTFGFHYQQELSDWGYRLTKDQRFFVVDELSLPPCEDEIEKKKQTSPNFTSIDSEQKPLEQVTPLEEFREVAKDVVRKL